MTPKDYAEAALIYLPPDDSEYIIAKAYLDALKEIEALKEDVELHSSLRLDNWNLLQEHMKSCLQRDAKLTAAMKVVEAAEAFCDSGGDTHEDNMLALADAIDEARRMIPKDE